MLCCDTSRGRHSSRVAWLVYVRTYCVPIATLNQNMRSRLLYLGDAKIISRFSRKCTINISSMSKRFPNVLRIN